MIPTLPMFLVDHWFAAVLILAAVIVGVFHLLLARSHAPAYRPAHLGGFILGAVVLAAAEIALLTWGGFGLFSVFHNVLLLVALAGWVLAALIGASVVLIPQLAADRIVSLPLFVAIGLLLAGFGGFAMPASF